MNGNGSNGSKPDKNKDLMLAAGSKKGDYDPEAPDQWKWMLRQGKPDTEVLLAWIKSKTVAFRHNSPFCVDEHGNALYIRHAAADLGWKEHTVQNVLTQLQAQGRIRLEGKRIWYCADIPQAHEPPVTPEEKPLTAEEEEQRRKDEDLSFVQRIFGAYVADFIRNAPKEKQPAFLTKLKKYADWRRALLADGMAAMRVIADEVEDTTLREIGIPKKRLPKREKDETTPRKKWVQVSLFAAPEFVQTHVNGAYKPETDFVDARARSSTAAPTTPLEAPLPTEPPPSSVPNVVVAGSTTTTKPEREPVDSPAEIEAVAACLGGITTAAAVKFLADCRRASPGCTVADIIPCIADEDAKINRRKVKNPTGVLLTAVPGKLATRQRDRARAPARKHTEAERIMALQWLADNDEDPEARKSAKRQLAELNGKTKGANG